MWKKQGNLEKLLNRRSEQPWGLLGFREVDGLEKRLKRIGKRTDAFIQRLVDEHRNGKHSADTIIGHLLIQQRSQPEYYTDRMIKGLALIDEN
ncbi:Cytochrome P450 81E8, partial [Mucuna pruriens]